MRKLVVSMNITLDGFIAGPRGELDWHFKYWDNEMVEYAGKRLSMADTILLGRVTYEAMAGYWPAVSESLSCSREDIAMAQLMNEHTKLVFSQTIKKSDWQNSNIVSVDVCKEVAQQKTLPGKDIILYGSCSIVSTLMKSGLIDEYILWIHPVLLRDGIKMFTQKNYEGTLAKVYSKTFASGVVIVNYVREGKMY